MAKPRQPQKDDPPPAATDALASLAALSASAADLAQQLLADPRLDPHTLANALERLILAQSLQTLANPSASPQDRAAAHRAFHQWRQADLTRQRLELERQKIELSRQRLEAQKPPDDPSPEPYDEEETAKFLVDQLDQILGLKPRSPKPPPASLPSPPPEPPLTPPPP
jgi:hypothetical protein